MEDFNCPKCGFDCYPVYDDEDNWGPGEVVEVIKEEDIYDYYASGTGIRFTARITCPKCGEKFTVEDSTI